MRDAIYRNGVTRNGVAPQRQWRGFAMRFSSGRVPGKLEAVVAAAVFAGVFGVFFLIVNMPGPLVVQARDDAGNPVVGAQVACTSPTGDRRFSGLTDVFGEAKWPGLVKGPWRCELTAPARYYAEPQSGGAVVEARRPATWRAVVERPARLEVHVKRPQGAARAAVAVRAVCAAPQGSGAAGASWEARAGVLDGTAQLWLPHGRSCTAGLVRPELPARQPGPVTQPALECAQEPCTPALAGGVGEDVEAKLEPTLAQWEAVRPPAEPDDPEPPKR